MPDEPLHLEVDRRDIKSSIIEGLLGHDWRQRGPYLVCSSCDVAHGLYIGPDQMLIGFDNGVPILRSVEMSAKGVDLSRSDQLG
jgi:hypothetical protein